MQSRSKQLGYSKQKQIRRQKRTRYGGLRTDPDGGEEGRRVRAREGIGVLIPRALVSTLAASAPQDPSVSTALMRLIHSPRICDAILSHLTARPRLQTIGTAAGLAGPDHGTTRMSSCCRQLVIGDASIRERGTECLIKKIKGSVMSGSAYFGYYCGSCPCCWLGQLSPNAPITARTRASIRKRLVAMPIALDMLQAPTDIRYT